MHPSHNLLTEDRVFIPRVCSKVLALDSAIPLLGPRIASRKNWGLLFDVTRGKSEIWRAITEFGYRGNERSGRREAVETPRMERRVIMVATA